MRLYFFSAERESNMTKLTIYKVFNIQWTWGDLLGFMFQSELLDLWVWLIWKVFYDFFKNGKLIREN
jgi:hypothetical protein